MGGKFFDTSDPRTCPPCPAPSSSDPPLEAACQCKRGRAKTYLSVSANAELQAGLGPLTAEKAARADTLAGTGRPRSSGTRTTSATWLMTWATRCKS